VGFSLHTSTPGSSCDCGHQACYHEPRKDDGPAEREEIEALKERIAILEEELDRERNGSRGSLASRLRNVEELVEKSKADMELEMKNAYRGIQGLWQNVGSMQKMTRHYDDRIDALVDANHATQDDMRAMKMHLIEVDDASMRLEDRIDSLDLPALDGTTASTSEADDVVMPVRAPLTVPVSCVGPAEPFTHESHPSQSSATISNAWTVHVSLLPTASQPFPFEKDTIAYKRCLSRGLHRIVAIPDSNSETFVNTISSNFVDLLKGRPWMPLVAKICDAKNLCGLPMLRQLPENTIGTTLYNVDFLKSNCATLDANGKIADLYIAMRFDKLCWSELRDSPRYLAGLEACWDHDPLLDRTDDSTLRFEEAIESSPVDARPGTAASIKSTWSPPTARLKRAPSEISRSSSFGSTDGESKRVKVQRQYGSATVERVDRRAEAV